LKRRIILFLAILLAYVSMAIAQTAIQVDPVKLQQIKPGLTTEAEVHTLLGKPTSVEEKVKAIHSGRQLVNFKVLSYGPKGNEILIHINQEGKVSKIIQ
jgi:hypothetical protein